jgi:hypothetical protein
MRMYKDLKEGKNRHNCQVEGQLTHSKAIISRNSAALWYFFAI